MIYLRADGNAVTGAGHLMRCLTIAEELNRLPETAGNVVFMCADEASATLVRDNGFPVVILGTDYLQMDTELAVLEQYFIGQLPEENGCYSGEDKDRVFLVDSYHVTDRYLKGLAEYGTVFLLDDLGRECRPVDGVINYNAFAQEGHYRRLYQKQPGTQLLIGSSYVPVRRQFLNVPYTVKEACEQLLITTGGGDSENIAGRILEAIYRPGIQYHVVVGRFSPHFAWWQQREKELSGLQLHYNVKDMAGLMGQCDLAVTAGGTTIYELAAIGVPFVCFSYAENQEALVRYVGEKQIAGYGGAYHLEREQTIQNIAELVRLAMADDDRRRSWNLAEKNMIDGRGARRIAACIARQSAVSGEDTPAERMQQE